jgi:hypothetical protein
MKGLAKREEQSLYETDFFRWCEETAAAIREGREFDRENAAEEIESLGRSDKRQIRNRLVVLIGHLLKCLEATEGPARSWIVTINAQRTEIESLLEESPSLRRFVPGLVEKAYPDARELAFHEMNSMAVNDFPSHCPFTLEQILDRNFLPSRT